MNEWAQYQMEGGVATITLCHGKVNALSPEVIAAVNTGLDRAQEAGAVVILTGQAGILSGGYDLKVMKTGPDAARDMVAAGSALTLRMLAHPQPIIVACPGHAIAKGAFLLLACDYRIGVEGPFHIGLNEVKIGMTMHHVGIELARDRLSPAVFQRAVNNAEMFTPHAALTAGFFDAVVAPDQLMDAARAMAALLMQLNGTAHTQTKRKVRKALLDTLASAIEVDKLTGLT